MNKFRRTMTALPIALFSVSTLVFAAAPASATADTTACTVKAVGSKNTTGNPDSRFTLNKDGTISAAFTVTGNSDCKKAVTLADWQAPNPKKGKPYSTQKLYKFVTGNFGVGTHTLSVQLPNCYYQVDLIPSSSPTDANGGPRYGKGNLIGNLHGGTQACVQTPPTTPTPPPTPTTPVTPQSPTVLPNTGAGSNVFLIALGVGALGAAFQYARQLRAHRSFNQ